MTTLTEEILNYLKKQKEAKSVEEITRNVFNPKVLTKVKTQEYQFNVYWTLLKMRQVQNINPQQGGRLLDRIQSSRWQIK